MSISSISQKKHKITAQMYVNVCNVEFQIDSGADVNTLCQKYVKREQVVSTDKRLTMWNKTKLDPLDELI